MTDAILVNGLMFVRAMVPIKTPLGVRSVQLDPVFTKYGEEVFALPGGGRATEKRIREAVGNLTSSDILREDAERELVEALMMARGL